MKRLIVALTVMAIAIGGGAASCIVVKNKTDEIISVAGDCIKRTDDVQKAEEMINLWEKSKKTLSFFVNHKNLSLLKSYIAQLESDKENTDKIYRQIIKEAQDICYDEIPFAENVF